MAKPEWGVKRSCLSCGARFYDLRRDPIVCPGCGATFEPEATLRQRRPQRPAPEKAPVPKPAPAANDDTDAEEDDLVAGGDDLVEADDDTDEAVIEDTSDLGEDDDVSAVAGGAEKEKTSD